VRRVTAVLLRPNPVVHLLVMAYLQWFEHCSPLRNGPTHHLIHQRFLFTVILRLRPGRLFVRCFLLLRLLLEASLPHASLLVKSSGFMEFSP
jgi:hypothetical protein